VDPNLVNAWGLVFNPFGAAWVADNGSGLSTLYDGAGNIVPLVVQIPSPSSSSGGNPTGIVNNGSSGFVVSQGALSGPSRFIFDTEDGVIAGWAPNVDGTHALRVIDNSPSGAVYKGLALSAGGNGALLYATDFHNNKIDVFDGSFHPVALPGGAFRDSRIPTGFAPFGIQAIGGDLYVTYAMQDADKHDNVNGPGLGYVDVYDPNGNLLRRLASRGPLNAPWGVALAPAGFGRASNLLLVGNFGDGRINVYDTIFGIPLGNLRGADHHPIQIDGLWGLAFGNGYLNQSVNTLYFTAGPQDESHGLYGSISAIQ
ncbi:MAG: TIGR03118 family protein, partial [Rhodanobacteraceae bacterium]